MTVKRLFHLGLTSTRCEQKNNASAVRFRFFLGLRCCAIVYLCISTGALAQSPSDEERIRGARTESNQAIARHDVPGILASMEEGYRVSASSGGFLSSRKQMGEAFDAHFVQFADALYERKTQSVDLSSAGPLAAESGSWVGSWSTDTGPRRTGGRYLAYWRKSGDEWLIHSELFVPLFCEGAGC